ncbi:MAG: tRNA (N(6)-L-threonylcarbamoyladenosine(37)-C(2))-methylthiotransferase MtaB [Chloroflexi bacterium]|nr:tRNA (N(6)-L-threonylcarbamoyladenosine(37)-C(2))-methylthiotransferase MtaB [Chloroflexota bacterium]
MDVLGRPAVSIATLGCRVNQADSDGYAQRFADAGYELVSPEEPADVCVINSCTVTNVGDQKSRQLIQRLRRQNPDALLAVAGCYAAVAPLQVERATGADVIAGLADKEQLVDLVSERLAERGWSLAAPTASELHARAVPRTRINVKVQDGCNDFCTYCIVPFSRGRARSIPIHDVLRQVRRAEAEGYQEVVLTGVNMSAYGRELDMNFGALLEAVLTRTAIPRLRLSSIEPHNFDPAWLSLWGSSRLCRHLHLPLQSGCDGTLARMRRRYDSPWFGRLVEAIRGAVPEIAIWTDVIAGFPGETDEEFEASFSFIERVQFAGIHVFRYSPRSGTRALRMDGRVPDRVKKERSQRLLTLSAEGKRRYASRVLGSTVEVLFEEAGSGLTDTYVRVSTPGGAPNSFGRVHVTALSDDGVEGALLHA